MRGKFALIIVFLLLLNIFSACSDSGIKSNNDYSLLTSEKKLFAKPQDGGLVVDGHIKSVIGAKNDIYILRDNSITKSSDDINQLTIYTPPDGRQIISISYSNDKIYSFETDGSGTFLVSVEPEENTAVSLQETIIEENEITYRAVVSNGFAAAVFDSGIRVYDINGRESFEIKSKDFVVNVISDDTGNVYVLTRTGNGSVLYDFDVNSNKLRKMTSLPPATITCDIYASSTYDLLYQSDNSLWGIKTETREIVLIADLMESDVDPASVISIFNHPAGGLMCFVADKSFQSNTLYALSDSAAAVEKQTLTLALFNTDGSADFLSHVARYNRANPDYRIEIIRYGSNTGYYEYNRMNSTEGIDKFALDVTAGKIPDIIDVSTLPVERLARKGLFEDLYKYIDSDSKLKRGDFYPNLLNAMEIDGHLYNTLSFFSLMSAYAHKADTENLFALTYSQAMDAYSRSGSEYFFNISGESFLSIIFCAYYVDEFINFNKSTCGFDSPQFVDYLKMLKMMPKENLYDNEGTGTSDYFLNQTPLSIGEMLFDNSPIWQDDIIYTGVPSGDDSRGIICGAGTQLAISSASPRKDAAWNFVRTMLTEEYQNGQGSLYLKSNITSQNNNYNFILDRIEDDRIDTVQKRYNTLMDVFVNTHKLYRIDYALYDIIVEEALGYLAGDKTAAEIAAVIQSRASLYVAEQR